VKISEGILKIIESFSYTYKKKIPKKKIKVSSYRKEMTFLLIKKSVRIYKVFKSIRGYRKAFKFTKKCNIKIFFFLKLNNFNKKVIVFLFEIFFES